jgi:hypothetical protein
MTDSAGPQTGLQNCSMAEGAGQDRAAPMPSDTVMIAAAVTSSHFRRGGIGSPGRSGRSAVAGGSN